MLAACLPSATPNESYDGSRFARVLLNPWFLAIAIAVLLLGISLQTSRFGDEAIWAYSSWLWAAHDAPPYVGSFENKPPAIFLLYRLCYELFGLSYLPVRILSSAALLGTMFLLYSLGRSYGGKIAGAMAVLIFGLTMIHPVTDGQLRALTETFMIFFTIGAVYLLSLLRENDSAQRRRRLLFGVGAALGVALSFKQTALFDVIGLIPLYVFTVLRAKVSKCAILRGMLAVFFGGCLVTALSIVPLLASGVTLCDYWNGAWGILLHQATNLPFARRVELFVEQWVNLPCMVVFLFVPYYLAKRGLLQKAGVPFGSLLFWLGMDFVAANASNVFGHHMKQVMAPLGLVAGIGISTLLQATASSRPRLWGWIYAALVAVLVPYGDVFAGVEHRLLPSTPSMNQLLECRERRVAEYIDAHTGPSDNVYIWDTWSHAIHVFARRRSSCRYFNTYLRFAPDFPAAIAADLAARPPKLVIINRGLTSPPPCVLEFAAEKCTPVGWIDYFEVFRLSAPGK
jgi:4-amino-4-deoxy-L-arabinose transferase-like glycosyltransferase